MSYEEFGFVSHGRITLPCDAAAVEYAMRLLRKGSSADVEKAFLSTMAVSCHYASCIAIAPFVGVSHQAVICSSYPLEARRQAACRGAVTLPSQSTDATVTGKLRAGHGGLSGARRASTAPPPAVTGDPQTGTWVLPGKTQYQNPKTALPFSS